MLKVLVIEDDAAIRSNIVDLLEAEGFVVASADNGRSGVALFRREHPQLVICDVRLPELDGFGVLAAVRSEPDYSDTPFIFLSAHAERAQIREGMKLGADDYLTKPFTRRELLDAIEGRLSRHGHNRTTPLISRDTPPARLPSIPAPKLNEGEELYGSYRLLELVGRGGMGAVYAAEHVLIGKRAAVKVLLPEVSRSRDQVARFFNEAKSAASIRDPGIVEVFDFGHDRNGNAYLVMELLEGENLGTKLLIEPKPPLEFVAQVCRQTARIVGAAHACQIVHRDLKPDNIFLVDDPDMPLGFRVKVLDFGIAKLAPETGESMLTKSGDLLGTPLYMSPEQCRGLGEVDYRADIYALGCILYELLCGHPPFVRGGLGLVLGAHIYAPVPPPRSVEPRVSEAMEAVVMRALEKDVDKRYQSLREFATELDQAVSAG